VGIGTFLGCYSFTAFWFDIDALVSYLTAHSPVAPGPGDRITKTA